jgi:biopolymer transport protein ExbD
MSGGDVAAAEPKKKGKHSKRKKGRRLGVRIDMTPLVDVAFLLLTFFMFTTSMSKPQVMEINLPPDNNVKVEIAESNLLSIAVSDKGLTYWRIGGFDPYKRVELAELRKVMRDQNKEKPKLVTLLKVDRTAKYEKMVAFIDEINLAGITRFSLVSLSDADKALIAKTQ